MIRYFVPVLCIFCILSCEKDKSDFPKVLFGQYVGTFHRESIFPSDTSNVVISFTLETWEGVSDHGYYPALCNGKYSTTNDTIIFENECAWTGHFDWELILHGKYVMKFFGDTLELSKQFPNAINRYKLTRK